MPVSTGTRTLGERLNVFSPSWSGARLGIVIGITSDTNVELFVFFRQSDAGREPFHEYRLGLDVYDKDRAGDSPAGQSEMWAEVQTAYGVA